MPELAEVEFYRRQWAGGIGRKIEGVHVNPGARVFRKSKGTEIQRCLDRQETFKQRGAREELDLWL